jgi:hypothetical protein
VVLLVEPLPPHFLGEKVMTARQRIRYAIARLEKQKGWCRWQMRKTPDGVQNEQLTLADVNNAAGCLIGSMITGRELLKTWTGKLGWNEIPHLTEACRLMGFNTQGQAMVFNDKQRSKAPVLRRLHDALKPKAKS